MASVTVLYGGLSSEREVSLSSGKAVADACEALGHAVTLLDVTRDVAQQLSESQPDIVFNALHGTYGEDGCVQGVLEFLQVPYTHSGVRASAVAMHKPLTLELAKTHGVEVAESMVLDASELKDNVMERPFVVKPVADGSSCGVVIVGGGDSVKGHDLPEGEVLVEKFIEGKELTVAVLDGKGSLGVCEIRPKAGFYDYANKYTAGNTDYIIPAEVEDGILAQAQDWAMRMHELLGCRGVSRSDFRLDDNGQLYFLEINTHPGMTATSLVPKLAQGAGMSFEDVVERLLECATRDYAS